MFKILIILVLVSIPLFGNNAFGQYTYAQHATELPQVLLQLIVRDSEGRLISYIETNQIVAINPTILDGHLDNISNRKTIAKDGKLYEILQWQGKTEIVGSRHAMTLFVLYVPLNDTYQSALEVIHNSYQVEPDDTIKVYWTVTRPLN